MSRKGSTKPPKRSKNRAHKKSGRAPCKLPVQAYKKGAFKLPEQISTDKSLSPKTPQVAMTLFSHLNKSGYCCLRQTDLAKYADVCVNTVRNALRELEKAGYITIEETSAYYNKRFGRVVKGGHIYRCHIPTTGFIFVPRRVLYHVQFGKVQGSTAKVYLYIIYRQNNGRAWPSLSLIARETGLSRKSVCVSKKVLTESGLIHVQHCRKENKAYSCNSYFKLQECVDVAAQPAEVMTEMTAVMMPERRSGWPAAPWSACLLLFLPYLSISKRVGQHARNARQGGGVIFAQLC